MDADKGVAFDDLTKVLNVESDLFIFDWLMVRARSG